MVRVAINGFGRIGRNFFRAAFQNENIRIVAVNDVTDAATLAHLLKYDTVFGKFKEDITTNRTDLLTVGGREVTVFSEKNPENLPWKDLRIDVVLEATGVFTKRSECEKHIKAGAKRVLLSAPAKDEVDATVVLGVNDSILKPHMRIISNASCTTNCLAPMVKLLDEKFGIVKAVVTTVHAYTNDQRILDLVHSDLRRARAAALNIIPTTTGAAKAAGLVYPPLKGKINGMAVRVPVANGSLCDIAALLKRNVTEKEVNEAFRKAAQEEMKGILEYSEEPLVSSDIVGNPHSCVFDSLSTMVVDGNLLKVVGWYDNEWGYSHRCVDIIIKMAAMDAV
ncbi:MAG: type I glyceraldehyde-3-phosphate dehydrogenase [Planctomycetota bacterium]|nr:type I glyceraldehyde-3-phosphate dehydrogenase [Planctomycetota bacterium]